jgi:hypothetical protein
MLCSVFAGTVEGHLDDQLLEILALNRTVGLM